MTENPVEPWSVSASRALIDSNFQVHAEVLAQTHAQCSEPLLKLAELAVGSIERGGRVFFFGNGGSAADAQHWAAELTVRLKEDRPPLPGIALTVDTSALTAAANDYGFDQVFARQIAALGTEKDLAIAISTSGNSPNVVNAVKVAKSLGMSIGAFTGAGGGALGELAEVLLAVPAEDTGRIQEMHALLGHTWCGLVERMLGLL